MFKTFVCTVAAAVVLIAAAATSIGGRAAYAAEATAGDNKPSAWAQPAIDKAIALGYVPQRLQSNYRSPITREEFAELIVTTVFAKIAADAHKDGADVYWTPELVLEKVKLDFEFADAKAEHIRLAYTLGSINGVSDTLFAPDKPITRQEAAVMLVNTSHVSSGISYTPNSAMGFSDFSHMADWARPAVQAAYSVSFMQGVGGKFDYAAHYTREQSIVTMLNLMRQDYRLRLRGLIDVDPNYDELAYTITKNSIQVRYTGDKERDSLSYLEHEMWNKWSSTAPTQDDKDGYTLEKAITVYAFDTQLKPERFPAIAEAARLGNASRWDYGWMEASMLAPDSIVAFQLKLISGYVDDTALYRYGYPFVEVAVDQIVN